MGSYSPVHQGGRTRRFALWSASSTNGFVLRGGHVWLTALICRQRRSTPRWSGMPASSADDRTSVIVLSRSLGILSVVAMLLASCAPSVLQEPTQLAPGAGKSFRLTRAAEVGLSTGYSTTLRANTRWELVGTIMQGEVYRTKDQV